MRKIFAVLLLLMCCGMIGLLFVMGESQTEENTKSFVATVSEVRLTDMGDEYYFDIFTEEYGASLYIPLKLSAKTDLSDLQKGDRIEFRVSETKVSFLDGDLFVDIVSLKSENKTYISLDSYNAHTSKSIRPARIAACILAVAFLAGSLFLFRKKKKACDFA